MGKSFYRSVVSVFDRSSRSVSLYERLGGDQAIDSAVDLLYRKVLSDDHVSGFFNGLCMHYQRYKLKVFLTMAFGGPVRFTGRDLRNAHKQLVEQGLTDSHFDHVLGHLRETLADLNIPPQEVQEVITLVESHRNDVLDR